MIGARWAALLLAAFACSNTAKPGAGSGSAAAGSAAADPWAAGSNAAAPDPWQANTAPSVPTVAPAQEPVPPAPRAPIAPTRIVPEAKDEPTSIEPLASGSVPAGRYACQVLYVGANQMPTYMPSTLGTVEIDANGGYHAPQFNGGAGTTAINGDLLVFSGGSMNGWAATFGTNSTGRYIHFSGTDFAHPAKSARRGDSMCFMR